MGDNDTFSNIVFTGKFNPQEIVKGVDDMIDSYKNLQTQGTASFQKIGTAIDGVTAAAEDLQKTTGKPLISGISDGKMVQQLGDIKAGVEEMTDAVSKGATVSREKITALTVAQKEYKNSIAESKAVLKDIEAETQRLTVKQKELESSFRSTDKSIIDNRKNLELLRAEEIHHREELARQEKALIDTTAQIKLQSAALLENERASKQMVAATKEQAAVMTTSEKGAVKLKTAIANITDANTIAAREVSGITRRILSIGSIFAFTAIIAGVTAVIDIFKDLINTMDDTSQAEKILQANQKNLNDIYEAGDKAAGKELGNAKILYEASQDTVLSTKDRTAAIVELKKEFPGYFDGIKTETILNGDAKDAYDKLTKSIIANALAKAGADKINQLEAQRLDNAFSRQKVINKTDQELADAAKKPKEDTRTNFVSANSDQSLTTLQQGQQDGIDEATEIKQRRREALQKLADSDDSLDAQEKFIEQYIGLDGLAKAVIAHDHKKTPKAKKEIENIYEQELLKLKEDLAKLDEKGFTDESTINAAIEAQFKIRSEAYIKAFKEHKLTVPQLAILESTLNTLENLTIKKADEDFAKQRKEYLGKIQDELSSLYAEQGVKRVQLIQDNFERERQTILSETDKSKTALGLARDRQIDDIQKNAAKNGFKADDPFIQGQIQQIEFIYSQLLDDLDALQQQKLNHLAFEVFNKTLEEAKTYAGQQIIGLSEAEEAKIKVLAEKYVKGQLTYKNYQKALTKIQQDETKKRNDISRKELEDEIKQITEKLQDTPDFLISDTDRDALRKKREDAQKALTSLNTSADEGEADNDHKNKNDRIATIEAYTSAIGNLAQSVISFWAQANAAEAAALDRSIAIQNERVTAAQRVAEKGNAEYLQLEEERLQQLQIKRENDARRQLAINAALQASQVITALINGIAQGSAVGGPLGAIIGITAIVGAIASAYAISKSLQPQTPTFFVGTEDTGPGGNADRKKGFHAILHPRERVVSEEDNKQLKGISNKELVRVVNTSRLMIAENYASKPQPQLNLSAIDMANSSSSMQNVKLASLMEENNGKLENLATLTRHTIQALHNLGVNVNVDEHGLAISVMEVVEQIEIGKKT